MNDCVVFLLSGKAESGKDTVAKILRSSFGLEKPRVLSFGSYVKSVAEILGWDGQKDKNGRALLQWLGDGAKQFNPDLWVNKTIDEMKKLHEEENVSIFIISDCRYVNEITRMKEEFGEMVFPIRIDRPNHVSALTPEQLTHRSECDLDNYPFNYVVHNATNLATLERNVFQMVKNIRYLHYI